MKQSFKLFFKTTQKLNKVIKKNKNWVNLNELKSNFFITNV